MTSNSYSYALVTWLTALSLLLTAAIGLMGSRAPTPICPFPVLTIIPALILSTWRLQYISVAIPALLFIGWQPALFRGETKVPKRSFALFALIACLTVLYFVESWHWGLQYQGAQYTYLVCFINAIWIASILGLFIRNLNRPPSYLSNLCLHWMLFAWLGWYAFPYLGESP
jgi:hypothetical protein